MTFTYTPGATAVVSGIAQDFRGANNYRPNVTCDPLASGADRTIANWFNKACVVAPTDPSQPFGDAERNSVRGPNLRAVDLAANKRVALGRLTARTARRGLQRVQPRELRPAGCQPDREFLRHDHDDLRCPSDPARGEAAMVIGQALDLW